MIRNSLTADQKLGIATIMKRKIKWDYAPNRCQYKLARGPQCRNKSVENDDLCAKHGRKFYRTQFMVQQLSDRDEKKDAPPKPVMGYFLPNDTAEDYIRGAVDGDTFHAIDVLKKVLERQEVAVDVLFRMLKNKAAQLGLTGDVEAIAGIVQNNSDAATTQATIEYRDKHDNITGSRSSSTISRDPVWKQVVGIVDAIGRAGMVEKQAIAQIHKMEKYLMQRSGAVIVDSFEFNITPAPEQ